MWQKIQIGVIAFLLIAFAGSVLIFITVSREQRAMAEAMRAQAESMRVQAVQATEKAAAATRRASEAEAAGNGPVAAPSAAVFATGKIARPGSYPLATGSTLSARGLVSASGGLSEGAKGSITVTRNNAQGEMIQLKTTARVDPGEPADIDLQPGDIVDVE